MDRHDLEEAWNRFGIITFTNHEYKKKGPIAGAEKPTEGKRLTHPSARRRQISNSAECS
jgi:hypothetical protein